MKKPSGGLRPIQDGQQLDPETDGDTSNSRRRRRVKLSSIDEKRPGHLPFQASRKEGGVHYVGTCGSVFG